MLFRCSTAPLASPLLSLLYKCGYGSLPLNLLNPSTAIRLPKYDAIAHINLVVYPTLPEIGQLAPAQIISKFSP